jgi:tRNA (guanine6-N2)-methyltransferase
VVDPFCGDGTIAIETASAYPAARVTASDLDPARVANATANARRAGVGVALSVADAFVVGCPPHSVSAVVTNPPWNLAVDAGGRLAGSLDRFWQQVPQMLARDGRLCLVADAEMDVPGALRGLGYAVGLATRVRLAGRVSDLVLAGVPRTLAPAVPAALAHWRDRAVAAGVVTEDGF